MSTAVAPVRFRSRPLSVVCQWSEGPKTIACRTIPETPGLAFYRSAEGSGYWVAIHVRSGRSIGEADSRAACVSGMRAASWFDWDRSEEEISSDPQIREAAQQFRTAARS